MLDHDVSKLNLIIIYFICQVVEQAAASILDRASIYTRASNRTINTKVGSPDFCPSFYRLINNKILICNILATVFLATALINFIMYENVFLESRFHMPRPTGMFLGFNDPLSSRVVMSKNKLYKMINNIKFKYKNKRIRHEI